MQYCLERFCEILERTPLTLRALLGNLSDDWVMAKQYKTEIAPWPEFFRILKF